jgi:hypothetical protein
MWYTWRCRGKRRRTSEGRGPAGFGLIAPVVGGGHVRILITQRVKYHWGAVVTDVGWEHPRASCDSSSYLGASIFCPTKIMYCVTRRVMRWWNFFLHSGGWNQGPLDTAPLNGLLCQPQVIMIMEKSVEWLAGETEVLGENLPYCRFVHHKPHMLPVCEPGPPRWEASV